MCLQILILQKKKKSIIFTILTFPVHPLEKDEDKKQKKYLIYSSDNNRDFIAKTLKKIRTHKEVKKQIKKQI
jgi:hypothetical protein